MNRVMSASLSVLVLAVSPATGAGFDDAMTALRSGDTGLGAAIFNDLAEAGDGDAMFNLALLYSKGVGVPKNREMALYWAWRARLLAVPNAPVLITKLDVGLTKETRASLRDRLQAEVKATIVTEAPESFVRLALLEEGLAAKPDRVQIYVWYSLAAALGYERASALREAAWLTLTPKEAAAAEPRAMETFAEWCAAAALTPSPACSVLAEGNPQADKES